MTVIDRRRCLVLLGATAGAPQLGGRLARAQTTRYPAKRITIIVPWPAGGPTDIMARMTAQVMSKDMGQPMVVENRSGATGNIGAQAVARAEPDGHTLLLTLDSALAANPELYGERRMGFDVEKDLAPIMTQVSFSLMLAVHPSTGITNLKEFVAAANKGNGLNYSSAGIASPGHLTMEALHVQVGGTLGHIPYRGNAPATSALLAGEVAATFIATPGLLPHVRAGKLTALAVSGAKRSPLLPELSTIGEAGYSDATTEFTFVFLAPAGTPQPIIDELNTRMRKAMADPEITRRMQALAIEPIGSSPADASAYLQTARKRWGKLIKDSSIQPER